MEDILYACLVLLPFGISLRMSLRLLYGARGPQVGDPIYQIINAGGWALTILPLVVLIGIGTNFMSLLLLLIAMLSGLELILARRAMQRRSVWELLTGALSAQQPTPEALRNHQGRFTGIVGRSFRGLTHALEQGSTLPAAIGRHRRAVPVEAQAYAAIDAVAADPAGRSALIGSHRSQTADTAHVSAGQQLYQRFSYLCVVLLFMMGAVTFLAIKIIPSYQAIFDDFDLELPAITTSLIAACDLFNLGYISAIVVFCFGAVALLSAVAAVMYLCDVPALTPAIDYLFFTKHRALVLRLFAVAAERGQPFDDLTQQLTEGDERYPSWSARAKLRNVGRALKAGSDWNAAMCKASFINQADLPMLETAQKAGNLPWVLRMLADQKVRMMIFRWSAFEQIAFPVTVVLVGLVVLWICVALFLPLVNLINGLV